jgi:hypothetical protein
VDVCHSGGTWLLLLLVLVPLLLWLPWLLLLLPWLPLLLLLLLRPALLIRAAVIQQITHQQVLSDVQISATRPLRRLRSICCCCCCTSRLAALALGGATSTCCLRRPCSPLPAASRLPASRALLLSRLDIPGVCNVISISCRCLGRVAAAFAALLLGPGRWQVEDDAVLP